MCPIVGHIYFFTSGSSLNALLPLGGPRRTGPEVDRHSIYGFLSMTNSPEIPRGEKYISNFDLRYQSFILVLHRGLRKFGIDLCCFDVVVAK